MRKRDANPPSLDDKSTKPFCFHEYFHWTEILKQRWFLFPPIIFLLVFVILPFGQVVFYSFWTQDPLTGLPVSDFSFVNYLRFFQSTLYMNVLWNTFELAGIATAIALLVCYPLAYWLGRIVPIKWQIALLMSLVVLFWTSFLIRTYAWIGILQNQGLFDIIAMALGLTDHPLGLLYSKSAVIIGFVHVFLPFMLMPIYTSVRNLDSTLLEAANDLGASPFRRFLKVTLPLTLPGILTGSLLFFTPTFGSFVTTQLLGDTSSIMIGNVIETQFGEAFNWPFGSALSVIVVIAVMGILILFNRYVSFDDLYQGR